jgi:hypothetical protein
MSVWLEICIGSVPVHRFQRASRSRSLIGRMLVSELCSSVHWESALNEATPALSSSVWMECQHACHPPLSRTFFVLCDWLFERVHHLWLLEGLTFAPALSKCLTRWSATQCSKSSDQSQKTRLTGIVEGETPFMPVTPLLCGRSALIALPRTQRGLLFRTGCTYAWLVREFTGVWVFTSASSGNPQRPA